MTRPYEMRRPLTDGERITALETEMRHVVQTVAEADRKLDEIYAVMLRGQGAWWLIVAAAGLAGFLASWLPWIPKLFGKG